MSRSEKWIADYLDGEISPAEEKALAAWLAEDEAHTRAFVEACLREQQLAAAVRNAARLAGAEPATAPSPPLSHPQARPWRASRLLSLAAAAAVVVLGAWLLWLQKTPSPGKAFLAGELQGVTVERGGRKLPAASLAELSEGDVIHAQTGGARVEFTAESTHIDLRANARVAVNSLRRRKEFRLLQGSVAADVAPQTAGAMLWLTDEARAEIVGTKFTLAAEGWFTRLDVAEGVVRFAQPDGGQATLVEAEQFAAADARTLTGAQSIPETEAAPWHVPEETTPGFEHLSFRSARLDREIGVNVMLPPSYDHRRRGGYPVLYLLHGLNGNEHSEARRLGAALRSAMEERRLPSCLVVCPNSGPAFPRQPMHSNVMVARELTRFIDSRYPTRPHRGMRALCGLGYGAQQAVILCLFHSDVFAFGCAVDDTLRGGTPGFRRLGIHTRPRRGARASELLLPHTSGQASDSTVLAEFLSGTGIAATAPSLAAASLDDPALPRAVIDALAVRLRQSWTRLAPP